MKTERSIYKKEIPFIKILGVEIAAIDNEWLINYVTKNISKLSGEYLCVANVHTTVMAHKDSSFLEIENGGIMAIPDGGPLASEGKRRGNKDIKRIVGQDFMKEIFKNEKYRHFFYGSSEGTLKLMKQNILNEFPNINIVGMYSPAYKDNVEINQTEINIINETNPDFVWVGLGAPKQERWMHIHQGKINGLMVGVGAAFDYFAGNIKRAPMWMQNMNLEWLYRLLQSPKKLFKRYFSTNFYFIWNAIIRKK